MGTWRVKTTVVYEYEVDADTEKEAEDQGWQYEDYKFFATVDDIEVDDITPEEDEE